MTDKPAAKEKQGFSFAAFDMFGSPVAFNIRGDETYKTVIGCFWTAVMLISLVGAFVWYFLIFLKHKDGTVSSTVETQIDYPTLDFYDKGFFLSLSAIRNKQVINLPLNNTVFNIEATLNKISRDSADTTAAPIYSDPVRIPLQACHISKPKNNRTIGKPDADGFSYTLDGVSDYQLTQNDFCTTAGEDNPAFVTGSDDSTEFIYIKLKISPCDGELFTCIMFYEESKMTTYLYENSELNPLFVPLSPPTSPNSVRFPQRIASKFVCNTLMRPPARVFHNAFTGAMKDAYDQMLLDYDANACYCGSSSEEWLYYGLGGFMVDAKPQSVASLDEHKKKVCFDIIVASKTRIDSELSATTFKLSYTEGSVTPDDFNMPFKFFLKKAASVRGSQ